MGVQNQSTLFYKPSGIHRFSWLMTFFLQEETSSLERELEQELAASRILDTYGTSLLRFAYSYVHNLADAQEIMQDVLLRYLNSGPVFETGAKEKAWLFEVCANLSKNRLRFNQLRSGVSLDMLAEPGVLEPDLSFVWQAVSQLPLKYRQVIHLYYQEGYTTDEIATILRQKPSTTRSQLERGRRKLKQILQEDFDFE